MNYNRFTCNLEWAGRYVGHCGELSGMHCVCVNRFLASGSHCSIFERLGATWERGLWVNYTMSLRTAVI